MGAARGVPGAPGPAAPLMRSAPQCEVVTGITSKLRCGTVINSAFMIPRHGERLQVDASQETRLRTFAVEDRLMAVEAAVNRLHAVLVPGDRGQGAQDTESKVR